MGLFHPDTRRTMASADLTWLVVRYSGLAQGKTLGVEPCKDGKGVTLVTRKGKGLRKPRNNFTRVELKRDPRRTFRAIRKITQNGGYRKDLANTAVRRAAAIIRSQRPGAQEDWARQE